MKHADVYDELKAMFRCWPMWVMLATQDIKVRYHRSAIGPFWVAIRIAITIYSTGYLYGHLFHTDARDYLPFMASGLIGWGFIASFMTESCHVFLESSAYIKNQELFLSIFVLRVVFRNLIVLIHNLLAFIPVFFLFHVEIGYYTLLFIPNLFLMTMQAVVWGTLFALLGVRYRDFPQLIHSALQILFFLTPVMWMPKFLPESYQFWLDYNVLSYLLTLIRNPLLNQPIDIFNYEVMFLLLFLGSCFCVFSLKKYKYNLVFWL